MQKKKSSVKNRNSAKQKIKKSDEIIVVARAPIEEIIKETSVAKEIKNAVKKILKPEKETLDRKVREDKDKRTGIKADDIYAHAKKILADAYSKGFYLPEERGLDYEKLFSYLSTKAKSVFYDYDSKNPANNNSEKELVSDKELTAYVDKLMILAVVGGVNDSEFEEKERMRYYAMFNKSRVLMKLDLSAYRLTDNIDLDKSI